MIRKIIGVMTVFAFISAGPSLAAEAVKLRHAASLYSDDRGEMLKTPQGAACTDNYLVVADTGNGRLIKYMKENGMLNPGAEYRMRELARPSKLQIDSKGDIFAFDDKERRIVHMSSAGLFIGYVQAAGVPAPEEYSLRSFKMDARDRMYLLDIRSERVLVLDPKGTFLKEIKFPATYGFFSDLAVDSNGTVFLIDTAECMVYSAAPGAAAFAPLSEKLKEYMLFPTNITMDSTGLLYITDQNGGSVVILNASGTVMGKQLSMGWKEGMVRYPSQACITSAGDFFIADRENNRVQAFTVVK